MINGKTVLAVIPARGGSKGVRRKNVRMMAGKPLIAWTIEEAKKSQYIDRMILSSEDDEIIETAKVWGCEVPFKRPAELAQDDTPGIEPVLHAIANMPAYNYVVLLQPTSPLRSMQDIDECIKKCIEVNAPAVVSITEPDKSPFWMYVLDQYGKMHPMIQRDALITRRQDLPKVYALNGAVYVAESKWITATRTFLAQGTVGYLMPKARSYDIDTELDFRICEFLLQEENNCE